ncbi:hypothetical protein KFK09_003507 [Dendrobium nobile]|uniref:DUF4283 domain-containing protein n=1 Tax=Dendrobium nobile TaxID=94219 RepID=A0A8T3C0D1_DENNO|nr:hypothetical protein KFK09_003507 [Dendrobium nobile]
MESLSSMDFPPLTLHAGGPSSSLPSRNWKNIVVDAEPVSKDLPLSFLLLEPDIIPFAGERLVKGAENWNLCLVGYSIGRRPYYEALLGAIRKTWTLKGSMQLLSLSDGFFLLRFTTMEDFEMAWSKGVWFFLGRPFLLQKWSPKFRPKRENFTSIPIWVKIHDLPLVCWKSEGISRIASKIGILLAVDALTAQRTRLTFARVCIQVNADATYPEEIPILIEDDVFSLKIQYEWKPTPCEHCKSLVHSSSVCPSKPETVPTTIPAVLPPTNTIRGRSKSRRPQGRNLPFSSTIPPSLIPSSVIQAEQHAISQPNPIALLNTPVEQAALLPPKQLLPPQTQNPKPQNLPVSTDNAPPTTTPHNDPPVSNIPNLNSPHDIATSSSSSSLPKYRPPSPKVKSPNKFDALNSLEEDPSISDDASNQNSDQFPPFNGKEKDKESSQKQSGKPGKNAKGKQDKKAPTQTR